MAELATIARPYAEALDRSVNGADALAGSKPAPRNRKGNMAPARVPHTTTPIKLTDTVKPISMKCSPYIGVHSCLAWVSSISRRCFMCWRMRANTNSDMPTALVPAAFVKRMPALSRSHD